MGRKIITTCGTSLLASNCWTIQISRGGPTKMSDCPAHEDPSLLRNLGEKVGLEWLYQGAIREYLESETKNARMLAEQFDMNVWNDTGQILKLPAELASLRGIIKFYEWRGEPLNREDEIVLLHSEDAEEKFCAEVIEAVLGNKIQVGCGVSRREIEGLNPSNANDFNRAVRKDIWDALINEIRKSPDEYIFNLTGGYKGTAIILGAVAQRSGGIIFLSYRDGWSNHITLMWFEDEGELGVGKVDFDGRLYLSPASQFPEKRR